jgi:hypothetical protein
MRNQHHRIKTLYISHYLQEAQYSKRCISISNSVFKVYFLMIFISMIEFLGEALLLLKVAQAGCIVPYKWYSSRDRQNRCFDKNLCGNIYLQDSNLWVNFRRIQLSHNYWSLEKRIYFRFYIPICWNMSTCMLQEKNNNIILYKEWIYNSKYILHNLMKIKSYPWVMI